MVRKLSLINYKGGVGKTSLVVNLVASLAELGKRVLLVDLDAQSNSSIWLMRLERWNPLNTLDTGHLYSIFEPCICRLRDCVVRAVIFNAFKSNMDIEVPRMRMQFRINEVKNQGKDARIFKSQIRDAIVVLRALPLGLSVNFVYSLGYEQNSVCDDYRSVAEELLNVHNFN